MKENEKEAQKLLNYFINQLKLNSWNVELKLKKLEKSTTGEIKYDVETKEATINIDFTNMNEKYNLRYTIIHELLHLVISEEMFSASTIFQEDFKRMHSNLRNFLGDRTEQLTHRFTKLLYSKDKGGE
ncbi:MAG: hypothetical protein WC413_01535 [Candidatus Nanoarchaeia archaeon]